MQTVCVVYLLQHAFAASWEIVRLQWKQALAYARDGGKCLVQRSSSLESYCCAGCRHLGSFCGSALAMHPPVAASPMPSNVRYCPGS